ncbi:anti-anti-sigma factor [Catenulispora sp. EB89]|uniref:STAS domain-containing protein n=1 Tax=Catenulispora sp. EB89 TaxID=3156257 RepID=UPI0035196357
MDVHQADRCPVHTVIVVHGELDLSTAGRLVEALQPYLVDCHAVGIGLDLSEVTFLDCSGLRALLSIGRRAADLGLAMCLAAESPAVARLLDLLRLPPGSGYLAKPAGAALTIGRACEVPGRLPPCYAGRRLAARTNGSRSACALCSSATICGLTPAHLTPWQPAA